MRTSQQILLSLIISCISACGLVRNKHENAITPSLKKIHSWLVDRRATTQTTALFYNLKRSAQNQVLFGHMEDNKNGYSGWNGTPGRSDVYEVAGNYPEVYGFDFGPIASFRTSNYTDKETLVTHDRVIEAYARNGVVTF